jgi:Family of unknown function (DUF5317)
MRIILIILTGGLLLGIATGGRPSRLATVHVRWVSLAVAALALQVVPTTVAGELAVPLLLVSFVGLVVFAVANIRYWGFELILLGVLFNFLVIGVNGGMPVSREALIASDQRDTIDDLRNVDTAKHHLADEDDRLVFLGDVIAIPSPVEQAISIGDLFTYGGVALFLAAGMRGAVRGSDRGTRNVATAGVAVDG